jgi:nucleotide-binding universal stress UspA family protein
VIEFKHSLCPTDLSEASVRPLTYAAALTRWYSGRLTVLTVVPTFDPVPLRSASLDGAMQLVQPPSREEVLEHLRRTVEAAGASQVPATLVAEPGDPFRTIVGHAASTAADLIVMGTHGRTGWERFMIGSIAEKVLRKAPCPVLLVPPHLTAKAPAEVRFSDILCPMDFSSSALLAFRHALDLARQGNGSVTVLYVLEWLAEEEPRGRTHFDVPQYRQQLLDDARQRLRALVAEEPRTWCDIRDEVVAGRAHREILRLAEARPADLIVMGAQGRGGLGLALFGSTTQQVVRGASCPVLTVRAPDPSGAQ